MPAPIRILAAEIVELLNAGPWSPGLEATREYVRKDQLPDLVDRKVYVMPRKDETTGKVDRRRWAHQMVIDIAISQLVVGDDENFLKDEIVDLADDISEWFKVNKALLSKPLTGNTVQALWDQKLLLEKNIITSAVTLTFEDHR